MLRRKTEHRLAKIADRLELLAGYIIAFLNLDRVIEIIRTEDEPKPVMIAEFALTDRQAEAILNMRLRSLRRLEEMEIKRERDELSKEQAELHAAARVRRAAAHADEARPGEDPRPLRARHRRSACAAPTVEEAAPAREIPLEAMIEREPITVILSQRGWIRAMRGHVDLASRRDAEVQGRRRPAFAFHAQTTDKLLLAADNGRFYTLAADKLPGGRGFGEPVRAMIDLDGDVEHRRAAARRRGRTAAGRGQRRARLRRQDRRRDGRNPQGQDRGHAACRRETDDRAPGCGRRTIMSRRSATTASCWSSRWPNCAELARGQGVQLQRYRDGGLSDAITFVFADGLSWAMGGETGRTRTESDLGHGAPRAGRRGGCRRPVSRATIASDQRDCGCVLSGALTTWA